MQLVENSWHGGGIRQRHLASFGRYDEQRFQELSRLVREFVRLEEARGIVEELEEESGPGRARPYFRRFRRVPR